MVEAGILAPIFAMMMMMTAFLMGTYETKYRTCMLARYATWSYASNACDGKEFKPITDDLPMGIKAGAQTNNNNGAATTKQDQNGGTSSNQYTNQAQGGAQASNSLFMAHGKSTMTWDYAPTQRFSGNAAKSISTEGQVVCNTPPPAGMNIFSYLGNILGKIF